MINNTCHTENENKETSEVLRFPSIFQVPFCSVCCDEVCFLCIASNVHCLPDKLSFRDLAASYIKSVLTFRSTTLSPLWKSFDTLGGSTAVAEGEEQQTVL